MEAVRSWRVPERSRLALVALVPASLVALGTVPELTDAVLSTVLLVNLALLAAWTGLQGFVLMSSRRRPSRDPSPTASGTTASGATASGTTASSATLPSDAVPTRVPRVPPASPASFVSVHVPVHSEPSDMVAGTLRALARQMPSCDHEIIVVDNNTTDETLWRPVERLCATLGPRFRFVHRTGVRGAKAGALDIARALADRRTTHVAVVDADYHVAPDFLAHGLAALADGADYVQFPQAYRRVRPGCEALDDELGDYFERHAPAAERHRAMLLTGTLSIVSVAALDAIGGWRCRSVTEDAELGLRLQRAGFRGHFVDTVVGRGLLPPSVTELAGQRHRWIVGNLHVLLRGRRGASSPARIDGPGDGASADPSHAPGHAPGDAATRLAHAAQLTAWCSFVSIPATVLALLVVHASVHGRGLDEYQPSLALASISVVWQAAFGALVLCLPCPGRAPGRHVIDRLAAWSVRWSLSFVAGHATLAALTLAPIRFRRTARHADGAWRPCPYALLASLVFCTLVLLAAREGEPLALLALVLLALVGPFQLALDRALHPHAPSSRRRSSPES